ncbi:MAG: Uma2 family endonuclease [Candidatus Eremiobacteraeota bacterium]|nr:Uma2 family endonuclease [Candidatus Eremiobacteraeota bacterium]
MDTTLMGDKPEFELLDGEAFRKVSPVRTHSMVQRAVGDIIARSARGIGQAGPEWRFRVGLADGSNTSLMPDVSYVSLERLRELRQEDREEPPFGPDIVAEVRSPSHRPGLLKRKIAKYFGAGTLMVLDIDPQSRRIFAHTPKGMCEYGPGSRFAHPDTPWLIFEVDALFTEVDIFG